jgi:Leucine-rich repeat (LRR) protein
LEKKLNLTNNLLESLPTEIGALKDLEELFLLRNKLTALPPEIKNMKKLRILGIGDNPCSDTPEKQAAIVAQMHDWLPRCAIYFQ